METAQKTPNADKVIGRSRPESGHEIVALVYRGEVVESVHYGTVVVVNLKGEIIYSIGDPEFVTFFRSASKPFQVVPLLEHGGCQRFGFTAEEIALMCGSHSGQPEHIAVVESILKKIGYTESDLQCGIHTPSFFSANNLTPDPGLKFSQLHHNCSGKHAGMLALHKILGYDDPVDYLDPGSDTQRAILRAVAEICHIPPDQVAIAIDGCSAPNFAVPLKNMAWGFATFASARNSALATLRQAMLDHPFLVSGVGRFDYALMLAGQKKLVSKGGAEALQCIGLSKPGWGIAIKIADGNHRALPVVTIEILRQLGLALDLDVPRMPDFAHPVIKNWKGKEVGYIQAVCILKKPVASVAGL